MKTDNKAATDKQLTSLINAGYKNEELEGATLTSASSLLDRVAKNGWRRPAAETALVKAATADLDIRRSVALPILEDASLDELAACLTEIEQEDELEYRHGLRECTRKMAKNIGGTLTLYKTLYGRYGKWLPFLATIRINERTAQRYMKMADMIDVPEPVAYALKEHGVTISTLMTSQDERIAKLAVSNFSQAITHKQSDNASYCPQPADYKRAASRAVKTAIEQVVPSAPPKVPIEVTPPESNFEHDWEILEGVLRALQHSPQFHERLLNMLEQYAPEVINETMSA